MQYLVQPVVPNSINVPWLTSGKIYTIVSVHTDFVMGVRDGQIELEAQDWEEKASQQWRIEALDGDDTGFYRIVSVGSGKVIDVGQSPNQGPNPIIEREWSGAESQQIRIVEEGRSGTFRLYLRHSGDLIAPASFGGESIREEQYRGSTESEQLWRFATVSEATVALGADRQIAVFEEPDYEGRSQMLGLGPFVVSELAIADNSISSIRVPENTKATLYQDPNFLARERERCWAIERYSGAVVTWDELARAAFEEEKERARLNEHNRYYRPEYEPAPKMEGEEEPKTIDGPPMADLAVTAAGLVWAVSRSNEVFFRDGVEGDWEQVPGELAQICVDGSGRIWGIDGSGRVSTRDGVDAEWQEVDGLLHQITVAPDGRVWGIRRPERFTQNDLGTAVTRDGVDGTWTDVGPDNLPVSIPGPDGSTRGRRELRRIAAGPDGQVWATDRDNRLWYWHAPAERWQPIQTSGHDQTNWMQSISIGPLGQIWGVTTDDTTHTRSGLTGSWSFVPIRNLGLVTSVRQAPGLVTEVVADTADLGAASNRTSSLLVEPVATIYQDEGFSGARAHLGVGMYDREELGLPAGSVSSLQVPFGLMVSLYSGGDYQGSVATVTEDAPTLPAEFDDHAQSIIVKAAGVAIPHEAVMYGRPVAIRTATNEYYLSVDGDGLRMDASVSLEKAETFVLVRVGDTKLRNYLSFGDVIALQAADGRYATGSGVLGADPTDRACHFIIERSGATVHNSFVSIADTFNLRSDSGGYLNNNSNPVQTKPSGWGTTSWMLATAEDPATWTDLPGTSSEAERPEDPPGSCGALACPVAAGESYCGAQAAAVAACGLDHCGADACAAAACGRNIAAVAACAAAAAGVVVCGADVAIAGAVGAAFCGAAANGIAACGADLCGGAACGAAACGVAACGAAACGAAACAVEAEAGGACGAAVCGAEACAVETAIVEACPADACAANVCVINACPADACAADACVLNVVPLLPGI